MSTKNPDKLYEEALSALKPIILNLPPDRREAALDVLTSLCTLAKDRPILAPHNIATGAQFSHDQWESYKELLGLPVAEKRSPFNFIGGMFYEESLPDKTAARELACMLRLYGMDEPLSLP